MCNKVHNSDANKAVSRIIICLCVHESIINLEVCEISGVS